MELRNRSETVAWLWATGTEGFSRATIVSHNDAAGFSAFPAHGTFTVAACESDNHMSSVFPGDSRVNRDSATPTTVTVAPFRRITLPRTDGEPPNADCQ